MKYITILIGLLALLSTTGCMMPDPKETRAKNEAILFKEGFRVPFYQTYEDGRYKLGTDSVPMLVKDMAAPAFELQAAGLGNIKVGGGDNSTRLLLFFAPSTDSPNSLQQLRKLSGWDADLQAAGIKPLAIVGDSLEQISVAKEKYAIKIPLLHDPGLEVATQYGCAIEGSSYAQRTLVGVNIDGTVAFFSRGFAYTGNKQILEAFGLSTDGK